ncbi:MAG: 1,6-anhydro-N-acetylmuramyl-L-alanine amidase AmpD [Pseudomonadota bacterium]
MLLSTPMTEAAEFTEPLTVDAATGLVAPCRQVPSPNCDERPLGVEPELFVIHCISLPPGEYSNGYVAALFTNGLDPTAHPYFESIADLTVSAHFFIARTGVLTQFVPVTQRAWHAGQSQYCGRTACNDFSVGIELEGTDSSPFAAAQYRSLNALVSVLRDAIPSLAAGNAVGHSDIAPGRKSDPGSEFNWSDARALHRVSASP